MLNIYEYKKEIDGWWDKNKKSYWLNILLEEIGNK